MKNLLKTIAVMFVGLATNLANLYGQDVPTISIQGTLKDASNSSVSDGIYTVIFRLFDQETAGNPIWQEEATVEVISGVYSHYLGSVNPLNPADFGSTLYLGLKVGNFELNPRTRMTYAPYTLASATVVCSGALGDVKYSIFNPAKFAEQNGDCWVPMDGRSIVGSRLEAELGMSSLPDVGGAFLRAQEFPDSPDRDPGRTTTSPVGVVQLDEIKSHNHQLNDPGHRHPGRLNRPVTLNPASGDYFATNIPQDEIFGSATTGITINPTGGAETRPINVNMWVYIRIN